MATVYHKDLTDPDLHEPKGIITAQDGDVYIADGNGSGSWGPPVQFDTALIELAVGTVVPFAGTTAPPGWFLCYGQAVSRSTYSDLFTRIGTNYGAGNGTTTFNIPHLGGRVPVGKDNMGGTQAERIVSVDGVTGSSLGSAGGRQTVVLTTGQMPTLSGTSSTNGAHTHNINGSDQLVVVGSGSQNVALQSGSNRVSDVIELNAVGNHTHTVTTPGSGGAHLNVQPTLILNYIIFHGVL